MGIPRRRRRAMRRKLKSGKSIATKTFGLRSRAAATSRRSMAYERGRTRSASVSPVTVSPLKSPTRSAPAAFSRWPPNPKISADGSRWRSSAVREPAYRSPDASPHEIMIRMRTELLGSSEQRVVDRPVDRHARQRARENGASVVQELRLERHLDAFDAAVVGEDFLGLHRRAFGCGDGERLARDQVVRFDVDPDSRQPFAADFEHPERAAVAPFIGHRPHGELAFRRGYQHRDRVAPPPAAALLPH